MFEWNSQLTCFTMGFRLKKKDWWYMDCKERIFHMNHSTSYEVIDQRIFMSFLNGPALSLQNLPEKSTLQLDDLNSL